MRERVELGFQSEEMRDAGSFAEKSLPEMKFKKMVNRRMMFCHFLMFLKRLVLCTVFKISSWPQFCQVCQMRRRTEFILVWISTSVDRMIL